ncbi:probable protein phosphatase 2C 72 [Cynara cardunculus var. scolymus]|uniref:probable protein phosphatase 2C 72 n=1 Tax=Cynara cardunculus var. scolymus TaxID=59895 RepID=UPI000D627B10|nr:probable protein phosphatase 2C 72 [Cynara cardunculus var. scolymus]
MGICISRASPEIHDIDYGHEHVIYYQQTISDHRIGSLHTHQGSKGFNQDAAILYQDYGMENGAFGGVFDGHGRNGQIVSKFVRNRLPSLIVNQRNSTIIKGKTVIEHDGEFESKDFHIWKDACFSAFKVMDKEIKLMEHIDFSCSGTTAVIVIKQGEDLVIANLGDSRAILGTIAENGIVAVQLTTDLKPSVPSEGDRIRKSNGRVMALKEEPHIDRVWLPHHDSPGLAMSRAFGDFVLKSHGIIAVPDVSYHRLTPNDQFLVLASDGVWDVLSNNTVASVVWGAESEESAAKAVVVAAIAAWKQRFPSSNRDDCTAICFFLQKNMHQELYNMPKDLDM